MVAAEGFISAHLSAALMQEKDADDETIQARLEQFADVTRNYTSSAMTVKKKLAASAALSGFVRGL